MKPSDMVGYLGDGRFSGVGWLVREEMEVWSIDVREMD